MVDLSMGYYHEHPIMVGESICKVDFSNADPTFFSPPHKKGGLGTRLGLLVTVPGLWRVRSSLSLFGGLVNGVPNNRYLSSFSIFPNVNAAFR